MMVAREHNLAGEGDFEGLNPTLYNQLRTALLDSHLFSTNTDLQSIFLDSRINQWQYTIPVLSINLDGWVRSLIDYLYYQFTAEGKNALGLFLQVLRDQVSPSDAYYERFNKLTVDLELWMNQGAEGLTGSPGAPQILSADELRNDKNFCNLVSLVRRGKALPLVGPGVSEEVGVVTHEDLIQELREFAQRVDVELPPGLSFPDAMSLLEGDEGRRRQIIMTTLRNKFRYVRQVTPAPYRRGTYRLLRAMSMLNRLVVTTNWDSLFYYALKDEGKAVTEICTYSQLDSFKKGHSTEYNIIKLRGSLDKGRVTLNARQHDELKDKIICGKADRLWNYVGELLGQKAFMLMGYRLDDDGFLLLKDLVDYTLGQEEAVESYPMFFIAPLTSEVAAEVSQFALPISTTVRNFLLALFRELEEFTNRIEELDMVFKRRDKPFIDFYGYFNGKSALLDYTEQMAEAYGWLPQQVVRVNLDHHLDGSPREPVQDIGEMKTILAESLGTMTPLHSLEEFSYHLRDRERVFVIFDATENVEDQDALTSFIVNIVVPVIQELNAGGQPSRLLLAGLYPLKRWPYALRRGLLSHALTPFDIPVVREMAQKFLLATDPDSQEEFSDALIADVIAVSSGYAGFIKAILVDLTSVAKRVDGHIHLPPSLDEAAKSAYVSQFNAEIDAHVRWEEDVALKPVYENQLCVFRWLNREIVEVLDFPKEKDLFKSLVRMHILSFPKHQSDLVIRQIKMLYLFYHNRDGYLVAHQRAQQIFANGMAQLVDEAQLKYIREWLLHTAYLLLALQPDDLAGRHQELVLAVQNVVRFRTDLDAPESMGEQLINQIVGSGEDQGDMELSNLLRTCIGERGIEDVFDLLKREVADV
ncbi:MAG: SIR2 family protein [Anaerolineae bacterium]|nr:SIR2 family protein [Anaerolineae bacterium]